MSMWTSLALLSVAAVSTLSFPHPGPPIPEVGTGTRAQFYVLKPDGTFTYGYDTGNGLHETATKLESGDIEGEFGYKNADGEDVFLQYIAGEGGFVPLNFLPVDAASSKSTSSQGSLSHYSAPVRSAPAPAPVSPVEIVEIRGGIPEVDGSYHFSYDTSSSSRSETADADLNIVGHYSFIADDGIPRSVEYKAGSATGFIAEGDHLTKVSEVDFGVRGAPKVSASASSPTYSAPSSSSINLAAIKSSSSSAPKSDASYSFSYDTSDTARSEAADANLNVVGSYSFTADDGVSRTINYQAGAETGFIAEGDHLPKPVEALTRADPTTFGSNVAATSYQASAVSKSSNPIASASDASYSFSYNAGDSSRTESADSNLNVAGSYSFTADDGISRSVNYKAGSATGFVAQGDHLPKPVVSETETHTAAGATRSSSAHSYSAPSAFAPTVSVVTKSSSPIASASDASYSFSYNTADSARTETADADLNLIGSYSYTGEDGISRLINYKAGSATGFVAEGDHLPKPVVADTGSSISTLYPASANSYTASALPSISSSFDEALIRSNFGDDGSYSFAYETDSSSRSESSDADLNVVGSYSFIGDDGISRSVIYKAGESTGFVAEGDHLPTVTDTGSSALSVKSSSTSVDANDFSGKFSQLRSSDSSDEDDTPSDASYSFSFDSDGYSRNEEADEDGNVKGSYTYTLDDGIIRTVHFVAGRETGFLPEGEYTEAIGSFVPSAANIASPSASSFAPSTPYQAPVAPPAPAHSYTASSHPSKVATKSSIPPTVSAHTLDSIVIGDVNLVHANAEASPTMYGYSFTTI